jgi:hypothetical protein
MSREGRDELSREHPELDDAIRNEVATWPPMPADVRAMWQSARADYLQSLAPVHE